MDPIRIRTRDGLSLLSYLTKPDIRRAAADPRPKPDQAPRSAGVWPPRLTRPDTDLPAAQYQLAAHCSARNSATLADRARRRKPVAAGWFKYANFVIEGMLPLHNSRKLGKLSAADYQLLHLPADSDKPRDLAASRATNNTNRVLDGMLNAYQDFPPH